MCSSAAGACDASVTSASYGHNDYHYLPPLPVRATVVNQSISSLVKAPPEPARSLASRSSSSKRCPYPLHAGRGQGGWV